MLPRFPTVSSTISTSHVCTACRMHCRGLHPLLHSLMCPLEIYTDLVSRHVGPAVAPKAWHLSPDPLGVPRLWSAVHPTPACRMHGRLPLQLPGHVPHPHPMHCLQEALLSSRTEALEIFVAVHGVQRPQNASHLHCLQDALPLTTSAAPLPEVRPAPHPESIPTSLRLERPSPPSGASPGLASLFRMSSGFKRVGPTTAKCCCRGQHLHEQHEAWLRKGAEAMRAGLCAAQCSACASWPA